LIAAADACRLFTGPLPIHDIAAALSVSPFRRRLLPYVFAPVFALMLPPILFFRHATLRYAFRQMLILPPYMLPSLLIDA